MSKSQNIRDPCPGSPSQPTISSRDTPPLEVAALQGIQGSDDLLAALLDKAVAEARRAIRAGDYRLGPDGTIPGQIAADVVAIVRWRWLIWFPQLTRLQTKERKDAFTGARETLKDIPTKNSKSSRQPSSTRATAPSTSGPSPPAANGTVRTNF